ncbi:NADH oxidase, partial [Lacticaseibacillus rhamnosus]
KGGRQGMIAGRTLFGNLKRYPGTQGTTGRPLFNHHLASTGLTLKTALEKGITAAAVTYEDTYRPKFMPPADRVMIRLVYARDTRRILGPQFLSRYDITQSANPVSVAIANRHTIHALSFFDMFFPP